MPQRKLTLLLTLLIFLMTGCQQSTPTPTTAPAPEVAQPTDIPAEPTTEAEPPATLTPDTSSPDTSTPLTGLPLVDDFETPALPSGQAAFASIGYVTWSDGSGASISTVVVNPGDPLALPEQTGTNTLLKIDTAIRSGGWGGFTHAFASDALDQWLTQDWSAYAGISFWLYGNHTGGTLFIDILDNRGEGSTADDAERWTYPIPDDFTGWQFFEIPFDDFVRKDIGNGAPNDGFTFTAIHGYALGGVGSVEMGAQSNYVDQVTLYGVAPERPVSLAFVKTDYLMREGGTTTINLRLNKPAEAPVTVQFTTLEGNAAPGLDFILPENTITFAPGATTASFQIASINDTLAEGLEKTVLVLTNPVGAILNPQSRAILTIRDDEELDPGLLTDFNEYPPFHTTDNVTLLLTPLTSDSEIALPGQLEMETILQVTTTRTGTFGQKYGAPQRWTEHDALRFWFYGTNSGQTITVELLDNRGTTTADVAPKDWTLVWADEFDEPAGTPPDPGIWKPEIGDGFLNGLTGWGNGELEYYTADNALTDGAGNLVITALELDDTSTLRCWYGPCQYTSSRLITWGRLETTFGRIEARLKLPYGQGLWPAFWMLGANLDEVGWPQSGEIDIIENIGKEPMTTHGTIHGPGYSGGQGVGAPYNFDTNVYEDFHTFAIEWTPNQIRWFVDEINFFTAAPDDIPGGAEWVYNHSFFIILNLAVGGAWPGNPDDTTPFPQTLMVDYVRVYGAADTSERYSATFTDDFTGWQEITLPFAAFTRSATQPPTAPDDGLNLDIWGYQFILPEGTFYLDKLRLVSAQ